MTTNAGSEASTSISGFSTNREMQSRERVEKALASFLRPEFINRIDEIVVFRHLDKNDFVSIAAIMMGKLSDHLAEKGITLTYKKNVLEFIAEGSYSEKFGARNMNRFIERNIEDKISEVLIERDNAVSGLDLSVKKDSLSIDVI
jgi:ATP-dependent Clp protease ATP-binding subunit ClpB